MTIFKVLDGPVWNKKGEKILVFCKKWLKLAKKCDMDNMSTI